MRRRRPDGRVKRLKTGRADPGFKTATRRCSAATRGRGWSRNAAEAVNRQHCDDSRRCRPGIHIGNVRAAGNFRRKRSSLWLLLLLLIVCVVPVQARERPKPPIKDSTVRIGLLCRWETTCVQRQRHAMAAALQFVRKKAPPRQKIHVCNRNSSRGTDRVDWIGFNNCIRNPRIGRYRH